MHRQAISPAWTDLSGFERLHSLSLIDYPHTGRIVNSPMVCLPRCLRRLEINDLRNFQVRAQRLIQGGNLCFFRKPGYALKQVLPCAWRDPRRWVIPVAKSKQPSRLPVSDGQLLSPVRRCCHVNQCLGCRSVAASTAALSSRRSGSGSASPAKMACTTIWTGCRVPSKLSASELHQRVLRYAESTPKTDCSKGAEAHSASPTTLVRLATIVMMPPPISALVSLWQFSSPGTLTPLRAGSSGAHRRLLSGRAFHQPALRVPDAAVPRPAGTLSGDVRSQHASGSFGERRTRRAAGVQLNLCGVKGCLVQQASVTSAICCSMSRASHGNSRME